MDPLRDLEEGGIALDHHPAHVDAGGAAVRDERREQLGHAAAAGGRVDVPDRTPLEVPARALGRPLEPLPLLLAEHRPEALERRGSELDLVYPAHATGWAACLAAILSSRIDSSIPSRSTSRSGAARASPLSPKNTRPR